jgi:hypothetical protein
MSVRPLDPRPIKRAYTSRRWHPRLILQTQPDTSSNQLSDRDPLDARLLPKCLELIGFQVDHRP